MQGQIQSALRRNAGCMVPLTPFYISFSVGDIDIETANKIKAS